jgi:hypothetical protein
MSAHARKSDPYTSHLAAAAVVMDTTTLQIRILSVFEYAMNGLTDEELVKNYQRMWGVSFPATDSSIRSRRSELVNKGNVIDTGKTRLTKAGNKSIVWSIEGRMF